jgi:tetratricopeptide (TPR) repeat protein
MEKVRVEANEAGNRSIEGRALIALGAVTAFRDSVTPRSRALTEEGLALLEPDDAIGRYDALRQLSTLAYWLGDRSGARRYAEEALEAARRSDREQVLSWAMNGLAKSYLIEGDLNRATELATEARRLAEESGAVIPHGQALHVLGTVAGERGELDAAAALHEEAIALFSEAGSTLEHGRNLNDLAEILLKQRDSAGAERLAREAIAMLKPLGDRGYLCESQRVLAEALLQQGRVDDAERYALEAVKTVGDQDATSLPTTRMTLGMVRAAQGRDDEAEKLLREANTRATELAPIWIHKAVRARLKEFLWARGRASALLGGTGVTERRGQL